MQEEIVIGAMIHKNSQSGEEECYNLAVYTEESLSECIPIFNQRFPEDYIVNVKECIVDDEYSQDFTEIGIGWKKNSNGKWYPPEVEKVELPKIEHIAVGSFYDRFGAEKWAILMSEEPMIRAFISDTRVRKSINLKAQDTIDGVNYIQTSGFHIDADMILNMPIQPSELP